MRAHQEFSRVFPEHEELPNNIAGRRPANPPEDVKANSSNRWTMWEYLGLIGGGIAAGFAAASLWPIIVGSVTGGGGITLAVFTAMAVIAAGAYIGRIAATLTATFLSKMVPCCLITSACCCFMGVTMLFGNPSEHLTAPPPQNNNDGVEEKTYNEADFTMFDGERIRNLT